MATTIEDAGAARPTQIRVRIVEGRPFVSDFPFRLKSGAAWPTAPVLHFNGPSGVITWTSTLSDGGKLATVTATKAEVDTLLGHSSRGIAQLDDPSTGRLWAAGDYFAVGTAWAGGTAPTALADGAVVVDDRLVIMGGPPAGGGAAIPDPPLVSGITGVAVPAGEYMGQATLTFAAGRQLGTAFRVPRAITLTSAVASVTTAAAGVARCGIYSLASVTGPTMNLSNGIDLGTIDTGTTGMKTITVTGVTLQPGTYVALVTSNATATLGCAMIGGDGLAVWDLAHVANNWRANGIRQRTTTEAWATTGLPATTVLESGTSAESKAGRIMPFLLTWTDA